MAHSKTSLGQILSQAGVGAALIGVFYVSFLKPKETPKERLDSETSIINSLDKEIEQHTTGKIWNSEYSSSKTVQSTNQAKSS